MANKIRIRRGLEEDLPNPLSAGEFGFCTDTGNVYIGNGSENVLVTADKAAADELGTSTAGYTEDEVDYLCDGTADDVEINAAVAAAASAGGGKVILLEGTYTLAAYITLSGNVTIEGMGYGTYINNKSSHGIYVSGYESTWAVRNLRIVGEGGSNNATIYIATNETGNGLIENCDLSDDYGVYLQNDDAVSFTVRNCYIHHCYSGGLYLGTSDSQHYDSRIMIENNQINNCDIGIAVYYQDWCRITGNVIRGSYYGIHMTACDYANITDNAIDSRGNQLKYGIYLNTVKRANVSGNVFVIKAYSSAGYGIYMTSESFGTYTSNRFYGIDNGTNYGNDMVDGIFSTGASQLHTIAANSFHNVYHCVYEGGYDNIIIGNVCDSDTNGITVASGNTSVNNYC